MNPKIKILRQEDDIVIVKIDFNYNNKGLSVKLNFKNNGLPIDLFYVLIQEFLMSMTSMPDTVSAAG